MANRPDYEDVRRLVEKMREGSKEARRELIEAHVGLAFKCSQEFEDDEALSDALCALVEEVDRFRVSGQHPAALPAYLKKALRNAALKHARDDRARRAASGQTGGNYRHCALNDAMHFVRSGRAQPNHQENGVVDLIDQLLAVCETEQEREMVFLKSHSLTNAEVALKLGCSTTHVATSMIRLRTRFEVQERLSG